MIMWNSKVSPNDSYEYCNMMIECLEASLERYKRENNRWWINHTISRIEFYKSKIHDRRDIDGQFVEIRKKKAHTINRVDTFIIKHPTADGHTISRNTGISYTYAMRRKKWCIENNLISL